MMRKLLIVVLCGFVQRSACSRMRFEQAFHEPMYRHDPHIHGEPVYKREHFFPREPIAPAEPMIPQQGMIRNEPIYGNEPIMTHAPQQQAVIPNEDFLPNEQLVQSEPLIRNEPFIRTEPFFRREPFIRREPLLRREQFFRSEPMIRGGRFYQNGPVLREGGIFKSEPNAYTLMVSQCPCQEAQNVGHNGPQGPQDTFFQIPQPIQPMQQQPIVAHRIYFSKPMIKPQGYQPIGCHAVAFPRIQRYVRKSFKPITENIQFSTTGVQNTPGQEFNSFSNEPVPFSGNFQTQGQQQENTSEPSQNNPVTVRNVPQVPNPLTLAQMSSIC